MIAVAASKRVLSQWLAALLPLAIWALLVLSLQGGQVQDIFNPGTPVDFLHGLRTIFPFVAASLATLVIIYKISRPRPRGFAFFGPLGLATAYGLVGLVATLLSPNVQVALYWVTIYLAVPLVLWAIVWGTDSLYQVSRLIKFNWTIVVLMALGLFAVALIKLDLDILLAKPATLPAALLECQPIGRWNNMTGGVLRATGVGRYTAIAGIIAISWLCRDNHRIPGAIVLIASFVLLMTTGARTAIVGFGIAAPFVILLYGGRKALMVGGVAILILLPIFWTTGIHRPFLDKCLHILKPAEPISLADSEPNQKQAPPEAQQTANVLVDEATPTTVPAQRLTSPPERLVTPVPEAGRIAESAPLPGQAPTPAPALTEESILIRLPTPAPTVNLGSSLPPTTASAPTPAPTVNLRSSLVSTTAETTFYTFSGRTRIWTAGWNLFKQSPFLGYGFHADRLILSTQMHNALMQSLVQTGFIGIIPFIAALLYVWVLLVKALRRLGELPGGHKHLVIQSAGVLIFLSLRAIPESTGAFFGVDWLLLAPLMLYLQVVNTTPANKIRPA